MEFDPTIPASERTQTHALDPRTLGPAALNIWAFIANTIEYPHVRFLWNLYCQLLSAKLSASYHFYAYTQARTPESFSDVCITALLLLLPSPPPPPPPPSPPPPPLPPPLSIHLPFYEAGSYWECTNKPNKHSHTSHLCDEAINTLSGLLILVEKINIDAWVVEHCCLYRWPRNLFENQTLIYSLGWVHTLGKIHTVDDGKSKYEVISSQSSCLNLKLSNKMRLYSVYYISVDSSTCFGCWHTSSGARTAVITASGTGQPGLLPSALLLPNIGAYKIPHLQSQFPPNPTPN